MTFLKSFGRYEDFLRQYELFSSIFWIFWNFLIANKLMTSGYNIWCQHFFYLETTLNRMFNNFITLSWYCRLVPLERPPSKKTKKKLPSQNPAILGLNIRNLPHKPTKFQNYKKGSDCELIRKNVYARKMLSKVGHKVFPLILRAKIYPW